ETVLEQTLQMCGLIKDTHYSVQETFHTEGEKKRTDFIIKLPDNKQIIIDSKVTFDYEKVVAAESEQNRELAIKGLIQAVKKHINDLAAKDYFNLAGIHSPGFVLMFMPLEAAYITVLQHEKTLFDYGYAKKVVLVSHTTLIPVLYTVANLWMLEQGNKEARKMSEEAGKIYNQVCLVAERFQRLGNTFNTASKQYNEVVTAIMGRGGLHRKVENFKQISGKITKTMPALEEQHFNYNTSSLKEIESDSSVKN
ncbi:MAG: DNA recombination protein RmuC, partial [Endozoicomonadaceae bacterium]|nr:DNA recombination protein RmuC [Endozoicomonadaceae bacterium]